MDADDQRKGAWSPEEDKLLTRLIRTYGTRNWSIIAAGIKGRSGKSCRLRWHNQLDPHVRKDPFTEWEDAVVIQAHSVHGNKWAAIAKLLPGRTDNSVKNHWNATLRRKYQCGTIVNKFVKDEVPLEQLLVMTSKMVPARYLSTGQGDDDGSMGMDDDDSIGDGEDDDGGSMVTAPRGQRSGKRSRQEESPNAHQKGRSRRGGGSAEEDPSQALLDQQLLLQHQQQQQAMHQQQALHQQHALQQQQQGLPPYQSRQLPLSSTTGPSHQGSLGAGQGLYGPTSTLSGAPAQGRIGGMGVPASPSSNVLGSQPAGNMQFVPDLSSLLLGDVRIEDLEAFDALPNSARACLIELARVCCSLPQDSRPPPTQHQQHQQQLLQYHQQMPGAGMPMRMPAGLGGGSKGAMQAVLMNPSSTASGHILGGTVPGLQGIRSDHGAGNGGSGAGVRSGSDTVLSPTVTMSAAQLMALLTPNPSLQEPGLHSNGLLINQPSLGESALLGFASGLVSLPSLLQDQGQGVGAGQEVHRNHVTKMPMEAGDMARELRDPADGSGDGCDSVGKPSGSGGGAAAAREVQQVRHQHHATGSGTGREVRSGAHHQDLRIDQLNLLAGPDPGAPGPAAPGQGRSDAGGEHAGLRIDQLHLLGGLSGQQLMMMNRPNMLARLGNGTAALPHSLQQEVLRYGNSPMLYRALSEELQHLLKGISSDPGAVH